MAKEYKKGDKYYLPVIVDEILYEGKYPVKLTFLDGGGGDSVGIADKPNLLLTATEIAENVHFRRNRERDNRLEELEKKNLELKAENEKLSAKVDNLETELNSARSVNEFAVKTEQTREKLIGEQRELIRKYGMVIDILLDKITALKKGENNG